MLSRDNKHVFIVDFGLAKKHLDDAKNPVPQRKKADFRGTVSFASLNAHNNIVTSILFVRKIGLVSQRWSLVSIFCDPWLPKWETKVAWRKRADHGWSEAYQDRLLKQSWIKTLDSDERHPRSEEYILSLEEFAVQRLAKLWIY